MIELFFPFLLLILVIKSNFNTQSSITNKIHPNPTKCQQKNSQTTHQSIITSTIQPNPLYPKMLTQPTQPTLTQTYSQILQNPSKPIGERYQAIFYLKSFNTKEAIQALMDSYRHVSESVLLTHEILYALGQLSEEHFVLVREFLFRMVEDEEENGIARHEAAEALANYFHLIPDLEQFFEKYVNSSCRQLSDTCKISLQKTRRKQLSNHYAHKFHATKEPAAPFTKEEVEEFLRLKNLEQQFDEKGFLGLLLKDQKQISLFQKYRIMYHMRDLATKQSIHTLCLLLSKQYSKHQSSLLKHQVCFILGQIGCDQYEHLIRECIENDEQAEIVRHEALAAVASQSKDVEYLQKFVGHENRLIKESAQVAEFTIKYWTQ